MMAYKFVNGLAREPFANKVAAVEVLVDILEKEKGKFPKNVREKEAEERAQVMVNAAWKDMRVKYDGPKLEEA